MGNKGHIKIYKTTKISYRKIFCKNNLINPVKVQEYRKYRNKLTKITKISKKAYFGNRLKNSTKNTSKIWKVINDITNKQKKDNQFPHKLDINKTCFFKPIDIVNKVNTHFTNIGKQSCIKKFSTANLSSNPKNKNNSFFWLDLTEK